ncbi:hypothetical protein MUP77_24350, partial [Candidatus Bathyarchaeota archaeon]|nr:hypothetical protein [Candidatus Bathyarchaeota archaeon]
NAFMLFNEAIVRGALEAGPRVCAQYAGRVLDVILFDIFSVSFLDHHFVQCASSTRTPVN